MRWLLVTLWLCLVFLIPAPVMAGGRVIKVLPQFLDLQGRHTRTPSLYDRDAYQAYLRHNPKEQSGLRFAVQWKARVPKSDQLKLRAELRGVAQGRLPKQTELEIAAPEHPRFSHWSYLILDGKAYQEFGEVTAWRVTLWDGDTLLGEQKSFLW
jgi:hypothetical protein